MTWSLAQSSAGLSEQQLNSLSEHLVKIQELLDKELACLLDLKSLALRTVDLLTSLAQADQEED